MMHLTRWLLAVRSMMKSGHAPERTQAFTEAVLALRAILEERKILEFGNWKGWHDGEKKIGISDLLTLTEETYEKQGKDSK
jgi:hypothetical protein